MTEPKKYSGGAVSFTIGMPEKLKSELERVAELTGRSRNSLITEAITVLVEKYKKVEVVK